MARKIIENAWHSYFEMVVPTDASPTQIYETRLAFYGGANALFHAMLNSLSSGPDETAEDLELMADVDAELRAFKKSI